MKVRYKPIVMEAAQFRTGDPKTHQHVNFGHPAAAYLTGQYWVQTQAGEVIVSDGDWIITGADGETYSCKPDIFAKTYEPAAAEFGVSPLLTDSHPYPVPGAPFRCECPMCEHHTTAHAINAEGQGINAAPALRLIMENATRLRAQIQERQG